MKEWSEGVGCVSIKNWCCYKLSDGGGISAIGGRGKGLQVLKVEGGLRGEGTVGGGRLPHRTFSLFSSFKRCKDLCDGWSGGGASEI